MVPPDPTTSGQTFGATLRQSELGLEVFGPRVAGAKTTGDLRFDFSGGFPNALNGVSYGVVRLRIADMRMDWGHTSVVAGQRCSVHFSTRTNVVRIGVGAGPGLRWKSLGLDSAIEGGTPVRCFGRTEFHIANRDFRQLHGSTARQSLSEATDGGRGLRPAGICHTSGVDPELTRAIHDSGRASGYYGRQDWGLDRKVDAWGAITDWEVPLTPRVSLTGEFYRGRAIGGFGGAFGRSVIFSGPEFAVGTQVRALNSVGGWSQLKLRASAKLEFNGAFGLDNPYAQDLRAFPAPQAYFPASVAQNRGALINFIYRPRSDLIFSGEYRHLRTFEISAGSPTAEQVNLTMGVLF